MKESAFHDEIWVHIGIENYPHILKLLDAMHARPEFKEAIAGIKPQHEYY
jgi:hypothetical protein